MSFDNPWQWSATAASNTAITSIDITGTTGKVKDGDNAIRAIMAGWATVEAKGSDVASAGTLTLGSQRYYHITGTTTITDIDFTDAVDGRWAWLIFDGALTLTHNSTTLKLPGGANIITAAGDRALFVQDSSDNVICLAYVRAAGTNFTDSSVAAGSAVSLTTSTGANVTSISLTAGDWEVSGNVAFVSAATTNIAKVFASSSSTSATLGDDIAAISTGGIVPGVSNNAFSLTIPLQRFSLTSTTTIYLIAQALFTVSTLAAHGHIRARRIA